MNNELYDAFAYGMRYWFLLLIALMLFTLIAVSIAEYKRHKNIMNTVGKYFGYLEILSENDSQGMRFGITNGTIIGSGSRSDIIIDDSDVAKSHIEILRRGNKTAISPIKGSRFFLNGCCYDKPCRIYSGDILILGEISLLVFLKEDTVDVT